MRNLVQTITPHTAVTPGWVRSRRSGIRAQIMSLSVSHRMIGQPQNTGNQQVSTR